MRSHIPFMNGIFDDCMPDDSLHTGYYILCDGFAIAFGVTSVVFYPNEPSWNQYTQLPIPFEVFSISTPSGRIRRNNAVCKASIVQTGKNPYARLVTDISKDRLYFYAKSMTESEITLEVRWAIYGKLLGTKFTETE